jgi:hypothetical protein
MGINDCAINYSIINNCAVNYSAINFSTGAFAGFTLLQIKIEGMRIVYECLFYVIPVVGSETRIQAK